MCIGIFGRIKVGFQTLSLLLYIVNINFVIWFLDDKLLKLLIKKGHKKKTHMLYLDCISSIVRFNECEISLLTGKQSEDISIVIDYCNRFL